MPMKARYTVVNGEVIAQKRNGVRSELVPDMLGSTVALVDSAQTVTDRLSYFPYGEVASRTGSTVVTPFQFVGTLGYYQDTPTRTYVRARYLDSNAGRWTTQDPIGHWGGPNLYRYCRSSPARFIDAFGLADDGTYLVATSLPMQYYYNASDCQKEIGLWRAEGLFAGGINHGGGHKFDYKVLLPDSLWDVHGLWLNSSQFSNYAAGYAGYYNGKDLGLQTVQNMGKVWEASEGNIRKDNEVHHWWDDGEIDKNLIMLGAVDAYMALRTVGWDDPQRFGWQSRPGQTKKDCWNYIRNYNLRNFGQVSAEPDGSEPQKQRAWNGLVLQWLRQE